ATFGASAVTSVSNTMYNVTLGAIQFNSGASSYTLTNNSGLFVFQGLGVVDSSGRTQSLVNSGALLFQNSSSAGDLNITSSGSATFTGSSTAGQARIINQAALEFDTNATAGNASVSNGGSVLFLNNASAGQANLTNSTNSSAVSFGDTATAGSAILVNNGNMNFGVTATGGNASISNNAYANLAFWSWATAGNASIQNAVSATLNFSDNTTAAAASITNKGNLAFNNNSSATAAILTNSGILDFNDSTTASNARITNSGILNFTGSSTAGAAAIVTNNGGRTVFEQGTDGGTAQFSVNSGGTFDASGVTTGTLTVGTYTQVSGGTLKITLGAGAPAPLSVTGSADLGGTLDLVFGSGFSLAQGNSVTVMMAANVSGKFDQWSNPTGGRLFPFYQPTTRVTLESVLPTFQVGELTSNEKAVAQALDGSFEDVRRYDLIKGLVSTSAADLPGIYAQMDPSPLTSFYQMAFRAAHARGGLVFQKLAEEAGAPVEAPVESRKVGDVRFAADMPAAEEGALARRVANQDAWKVSLQGYGDFGTLTNDGNAAGYKFTVGGLLAGADWRLSDDWTGGMFLGYGQGTAQPDGGGEEDMSGGQLGLYAGWHDQGFHIEALAGAGLDQYKMGQAGYGGTAAANATGQEIMGRLGLGYRFRLEELEVGPFASMDYTYVGLNSFNESGSNAPLMVSGQGEGALAGDLGLTVEQSWKWGSTVLEPGLTAAWEHTYQGNQDSLRAGFGSSPESFTVQGPATGQDALVLGAHLDVAFKDGWDIYGQYQGRIGSIHSTEQGFECGVRTEF
ncbi:MAG TPA: autotransporter domain-containing protein, partial [bacterium]|nr:autotransporter domain-containing protein [bacterium]